jgi:poly(hydroxyalkanoate) depolymerase family esterase
MMSKRRFNIPVFFQVGACGAVLAAANPALAATWQTGVTYGGNTIMDLYVPTNVDASPGIVVALHYCSGNASSAHSWLQSDADKYGFIIIAPGAGGNCFDATPARSGERDAITKMVAYVVTKNHADPTRVFAAGASSGACMTQALLAAYPEVFAGGSVLAGVPAGAWTGGNTYAWSTPSKSAAEWGDIVRKASPSFTGTRPRIQLWHGTGDTTLTYSQNFPAEVLQWTNVLGVGDSNSMTSSWKGPQDTWARISYKNAGGTLVMETNVAQNAPHDLSGRGLWPEVVRFFGLDVDTPTGGGGSGGAGNSGGAGGSGGKASAGAGGVSSGNSGSGNSSSSTGGSNASGGTGNVPGGSNAGGSPPSSGGSSPASAGSSSGGSKPAAGGSDASSVDSNGKDSSCSINAGGAQRPRGALVGLLIAGLAAAVRRRRRSAV